MRAEITRDGCLRITPQSDLEAYALAAWYAEWKPRGRKGGKSSFQVLTEPEDVVSAAWLGGTAGMTGTGTLSTYVTPWPAGAANGSTTSDGMCP